MKNIVKIIETNDGVKIIYRDGNKKTEEKIKFKNYFFIDKKHYNTDELDIVLGEFEGFRVIEGNRYCIVILDNNYIRKEMVNMLNSFNITTYEGDLTAAKRYMIDNELDYKSDGLKKLFYDIETLDEGKLDIDKNGNVIAQTPILSIAYIDDKGNITFIKNENKTDILEGEKELLLKHLDIISKYDILLGWNSSRFDDSYIFQRCKYHNISSSEMFKINRMDYMNIVEKNTFPKPQSMSLDFCSQQFLGFEKVNIGKKGNGVIKDLWIKSFDEEEHSLDEIIKTYNTDDEIISLKSYNIKDVYLMYLMENKLEYLLTHISLSNLAKIDIENTQHNSLIWDVLTIREFNKIGIRLPTKYSTNLNGKYFNFKNENDKIYYRTVDDLNDNNNEIQTINHVAGGYTFNYDKGVFSNVEVFDWSSLYPTVIISCNICPSTLTNIKYRNVIIPEDYHESDGRIYEEKYFRTKEGILSKLTKPLLKMRYEKKYKKFDYIDTNPELFKKLKSEENALKIVLNSLYGFTAFKSSRLYIPNVANAITQMSRHLTKQMIKVAEENNYKVIAGDTDSIFIINEGDLPLKDLEVKFKDKINELAKEYNLVEPEYLNFEHEKTYDKLLYIKPKNYATICSVRDENGNVVGKPDIDVKGLQYIKRDCNPLAKIWQKKLVEEVYLKENTSIENYINELYEFKDKVLRGDIDVEFLINKKGLSRHPDSYGQPMIDSKTGEPKLNKNGSIRLSPIPAHVSLAKKLMEQGKEINVGDVIEYIVKKSKPKIEAISLDEYLECGEFDHSYYYESMVKPILAILLTVDRDVVFNNVDLWFIKPSKRNKQKLLTIEKNFNK